MLDMARILPAAALTAIWLWQKRALAYALAGALLTFFSLLGLAITAMMISMSFYAQLVAPFMAVVFGVVAAVSLYLTVWYLKGLKNNS